MANMAYHEQWTNEWLTIQGVFTSIEPICESLKIVANEYDHNSIPMSFISRQAMTATINSEEQHLNQLEPAYMYSTIFKNIILGISDDDQRQIEDLVTYCRKCNAPEIQLNSFQDQYQQKTPIWWYTKEIFLYGMLNKALRSLDMEGMVKMGFFIRHLHFQLKQLHEQQVEDFKELFTVYRGQGLNSEEFERLCVTKSGLVSFNNFLSTSTEMQVAERFSRRTMHRNATFIGVVFTMTIDPTKISISTTPYARIGEYSAASREAEILFTMHTVFRIGEIKPMDNNNRLWEVQLTVTGDSDPELALLTDYISKELGNSKGWQIMGILMFKLGHFDQAEELYKDLLEKMTTDTCKAFIYHQLGWAKQDQGKHQEAVTYYEIACKIYETIPSANDCKMAAIYNNTGLVYWRLGDYPKALEYYDKSIRKKEKALPPIHPDLAASYNNIGHVYKSMGDYTKSLEYYEKDHNIVKVVLPPTHPDLFISFNNLGLIYDHTGDYLKVLEYYEKSIKILEKTVPVTHPELADSYRCIGQVYYNLGEYSRALEFFTKDIEINKLSVPSNDSNLAFSYNWFGRIFRSTKDYAKALESFENCLKIREQGPVEEHHQTAVTYSDIGEVHHLMGNYNEAVALYQKGLNIQENDKCNPLDCATTYAYLGETYRKMEDYSTALTYLQKALKIREENLPQKHPGLAKIYHNISKLYLSTEEYDEALKNIQQAFDIAQEKLPSVHPHLIEYCETFQAICDKL